MSEPAKPVPAGPVARGKIHDLGYKRYLGTRRAQATRWRVISRNQMSAAWKNWWRYKAWIAIAVLITVGLGAIMVVSRDEVFEGFNSKNDMIVNMVDGLVFGSSRFFAMVCFLCTLTVGANVVATDMRSGAFTFYFARPVRTIDYVIGKLVGLWVLQAFLILVPIMLLTFVRLGLSRDADELVDHLAYIPKSMLIGSMGALAFAGASLGFSSLMSSPRIAVALWAGYYIIISSMIAGIAMVMKIPELGCVDIVYALGSLASHLFEIQVGSDAVASLPAAVIGLAGNAFLGAGLAFWRVRATAHAGIGGGS